LEGEDKKDPAHRHKQKVVSHLFLLYDGHALAEEMNDARKDEKYHDRYNDDDKASTPDPASDPSLDPVCQGFLLNERDLIG
jgi:hypothetical protein